MKKSILLPLLVLVITSCTKQAIEQPPEPRLQKQLQTQQASCQLTAHKVAGGHQLSWTFANVPVGANIVKLHLMAKHEDSTIWFTRYRLLLPQAGYNAGTFTWTPPTEGKWYYQVIAATIPASRIESNIKQFKFKL